VQIDKGRILVPRLISFVPKDGNLKVGKNVPYLTHFPKTQKFQISINKLQTNRNAQTGKYEEPAPNLQGVLVLNFENWDLHIAWNLGFEYWDLVRLVYPCENGIYCQNR
jgi:hypothetical protein